jgi:hypothetical protein
MQSILFVVFALLAAATPALAADRPVLVHIIANADNELGVQLIDRVVVDTDALDGVAFVRDRADADVIVSLIATSLLLNPTEGTSWVLTVASPGERQDPRADILHQFDGSSCVPAELDPCVTRVVAPIRQSIERARQALHAAAD